MRLIPFRWLPASWGLAGRPRAEAEAHYYLSGRKLEEKLLAIRYDEQPDILAEKMLDIAVKHGDIDAYTRDVKMLDLKYEKGKDRDVALLAVDLANHKITQQEHDKARATLLEEPWVRILNDGIDVHEGANVGYFEFDWNDYFVDYLRLNGYTGLADEEIVEQWFTDICRSQVGSNVHQFPTGDGTFRS